MNKSLKMMAAAALAVAASAASAPASIVYSYVAYQGSSLVTNINLAAGGSSQTVQIYLDESLSDGSPSLIAGDNGLDAGGFSVQTTGTVPSFPALLLSIVGDTTTFPGGSATEGTGDSDSVRRIDTTTSASATTGPVPNGQGLISLGTLTIAPGTSAGVTEFKVWDFDKSATLGGQTLTVGNSYGATNGLANDTSLGYFDLDKSVTAGGSNPYTYSGADANPTYFTVTTTGVPEPTSLGLLALTSLGLLSRRRRKA